MTSSTNAPDTARAAALIAARDTAVACDLGAVAEVAIDGPDAAKFLNGQLSIDVTALGPGACRYASFNSPKGRMLANFVLWREPARPDAYHALLPGDIAPSVLKRLSMYVLRSKVALGDVSAQTARFGVGGPGAPRAVAAVVASAPAAFEVAARGAIAALGLPGPRFIVVAPAADAGEVAAALSRHAVAGDLEVWRWLTIRAGVPVITAPTQEAFVAQMANWDALGGIDFQKGCYTGQEIIARTRYLGRLKERASIFHCEGHDAGAGDRLFSAVFGEQPCGTVVDAAAAPDGGCDLIAVVQLAAAANGDVRLGAPDGPPLAPLPLPYALPAPPEPRGRVA